MQQKVCHRASYGRTLRNLGLLLGGLVAASSPTVVRAQHSYPMVMSLSPIAVQIGATTECEVSARYNLYGAYQVLVTGSGVRGETIPPEVKPGEPPPEKKPEMPKVKVRFTVEPDALPGVRGFRLATPQGATTYGQLVVVRDPIVFETPNNNSRESAQAVSLPATLCGAIEAAEDVDCFKFQVEANTGWTFHVQSSRCENKIHDLQLHSDPILTLKNSQGTVLASSDNYFAADPLLAYRFEAQGEYFLEIRDVRYQGSVDWQYSIEANSRPMITNCHPSRLTPGAATRLELVGYNLPADPLVMYTLPADAAEGPLWITLPLADGPSNAVPVVSSHLPEVLESPEVAPAPAAPVIAAPVIPAATETASPATANGAQAADAQARALNPALANAQPIPVPAGISGRIAADADIDTYSFEARQGDRFSFEIIARRHQSALDPRLRILNDQGAPLAEIDDMNVGRFQFADSQLENWTAPADGKYLVEVSDRLEYGGPAFVYFLQITRSEPYFLLEVDTDKTLLTPGTNGAIFVRVYRKNGFVGPIQLTIEGLPPSVTAECGLILTDATDGCIILRAAGDAPPGAANVRISGTSTWSSSAGTAPIPLAVVAMPLQETYMPGGGRGHWPVDTHTVSVSEPMDILKIDLSTTTIALPPGGSQRVDITIHRKPGFTGNVTLDAIFQHLEQPFGVSLPPGVTVDGKNSQTLLSGEQSQGYLTFTATADAKPVENQLVPIMANVSINFVMKMTYASDPLRITVLPKEPAAAPTAQ